MDIEEQIKKQLSIRPFREFWIETSGGNSILVQKPEWFFMVPESGGDFVVFEEGGTYFISNYKDLISLTVDSQKE